MIYYCHVTGVYYLWIIFHFIIMRNSLQWKWTLCSSTYRRYFWMMLYWMNEYEVLKVSYKWVLASGTFSVILFTDKEKFIKYKSLFHLHMFFLCVKVVELNSQYPVYQSIIYLCIFMLKLTNYLLQLHTKAFWALLILGCFVVATRRDFTCCYKNIPLILKDQYLW